jgi:hypothetical protein
MKDILLIAGGLIAGLIIWFLKSLISGQIKNRAKTIVSPEGEVNDRESFNPKKLIEGIVSVVRGDLWGKTINQELSLRTWMIRLGIIGIILGVVWGYGYYRGQLGKPVVIDWRGKEEFVRLNEHFLHIQKDGSMQVLDKDKKTVLKDIKVKDLDNLRKYLRPYGFILEPVAVAGVGISNASAGLEGGIGLRYLKYFKWIADICITNKGFYPIGVSYKITDNSAIGASIGTGYAKGERGLFERILLKFTVKF